MSPELWTKINAKHYDKMLAKWDAMASMSHKYFLWPSSATNTNITISNSGSTACTYTMSGTWDAEDYWPADDPVAMTQQLLKGAIGFLLQKDNAYELPDGSHIHVDPQGNYQIEDKHAQVIYKACRIREFNPYINASDLIAKFIRYVGSLRVRPDQVAALPLGLFVNWLIVEAAENDNDTVPEDVVPVPKHRLLKSTVSPRCPWDGRFVPRGRAFAYCNPRCASRHYQKVLAA